MNHKFDELAKGLAQSVTRRQALKKFGVGLAGMALAALGLGRASAGTGRKGKCWVPGLNPDTGYNGVCMDSTSCQWGYSLACTGRANNVFLTSCGLVGNKNCTF